VKKIQEPISFVSHGLDEALKLGNRIAIMDGGSIVHAGRRRSAALTLCQIHRPARATSGLLYGVSGKLPLYAAGFRRAREYCCFYSDFCRLRVLATYVS
jgi:hypothetical protein